MKTRTLIAAPFVFVGGFIGLITAFNVATSNVEYSTGTRVGYVDKFSKKGLMFATNEGQLAMQNFVATGTNGAMTNTFEFSVRDDNTAVKDALNAAAENRHCVAVKYIQTLGHKPWQQDTDYRIEGVKDLGTSCGGNEGPRAPAL